MTTHRKYAVIGAMCSGKTTLVNRFSDARNVQIVPDAGRIFLSRHPDADRSSFSTQSRILETVIRLETQSNNALAQLCDGSVLTTIAHALAYGDEKGAHAMTTQLKDYITTYNHFFLLNYSHIPYETDTIRNEHKAFRRKLHNSFVQLLSQLTLPFTTMPDKLEERVEIINMHLKVNSQKAQGI